MNHSTADKRGRPSAVVRSVVLSPRGGVSLARKTPPVMEDTHVLIQTSFSVLSPGTERAKLDLAAKSVLGKARARPDLVRQLLNKIRADGAWATAQSVRQKMGEPLPLGYSLSGTVLAVGSRVSGIAPGDQVAAGGGGYATHSDIVSVPGNLVARVPQGVPLDAAAFATLGAIAVHGFRLSHASVGESVAVIGLGLVGLLAGAVAKAAGCRVVGLDVRQEALEKALAWGFDDAVAVQDAVKLVHVGTSGRGADAILICAASTTNEPVVLAGQIARDRARVVVVGDVGLDVPRQLYYDKELEIVVSRSYGPGRYDPRYEAKGHDYPIGYVRWTEQRNMQGFLDLLAAQAINLDALQPARFSIETAADAYEALGSSAGGVALLDYGTYPGPQAPTVKTGRINPKQRGATSRLRVGLIGTGSFAQRVLVPALHDAGAELAVIASRQGNPTDLEGRAGETASPRRRSPEQILQDPSIDAVFIATRHDSHAPLVVQALEAGKPVFVEKPLALTTAELDDVTKAWSASQLPAMVGFNRRFAPFSVRLREALRRQPGPVIVAIRINAGTTPDDHWTRDLDVGGGRIVGEMCHFVDLASYLFEQHPREVFATGARDGSSPKGNENVIASLRFEDRGLAQVTYTAVGDPSLGKERIEAFAGGASYVIDDWKRMRIVENGRVRTERGRREKGHRAEVAAFLQMVSSGRDGGDAFATALTSTAATLALIDSLTLGLPVEPQSLSW